MFHILELAVVVKSKVALEPRAESDGHVPFKGLQLVYTKANQFTGLGMEDWYEPMSELPLAIEEKVQSTRRKPTVKPLPR
jgi:hypothetical protein